MSLLNQLFKKSNNNKYGLDGFAQEKLSLLRPLDASLGPLDSSLMPSGLSPNSDSMHSNDSPIEPQLSGSDVTDSKIKDPSTNLTVISDKTYNNGIQKATLLRNGYQETQLIRDV